MSQKKTRIHDWHNLKWPFTVTFLYYSLLSLFTGVAEWSETGFVSVLGIALLIDAVSYISYCFFPIIFFIFNFLILFFLTLLLREVVEIRH